LGNLQKKFQRPSSNGLEMAIRSKSDPKSFLN
jgi:hypothetical protein